MRQSICVLRLPICLAALDVQETEPHSPEVPLRSMGGSNTALGYAQQRKDFQATITKLEAIIAEQQKGMKILAAQVQEQAAQILKMSAPARSEQTGTASGREQSVELPKTNLKKAGWSSGYVAAFDCEARTIWIADAHHDGKRFIVHADEMLTAFRKLESEMSGCGELS